MTEYARTLIKRRKAAGLTELPYMDEGDVAAVEQLRQRIAELEAEVASMRHIHDCYAKLRNDTDPTAQALDQAQADLQAAYATIRDAANPYTYFNWAERNADTIRQAKEG